MGPCARSDLVLHPSQDLGHLALTPHLASELLWAFGTAQVNPPGSVVGRCLSVLRPSEDPRDPDHEKPVEIEPWDLVHCLWAFSTLGENPSRLKSSVYSSPRLWVGGLARP